MEAYYHELEADYREVEAYDHEVEADYHGEVVRPVCEMVWVADHRCHHRRHHHHHHHHEMV